MSITKMATANENNSGIESTIVPFALTWNIVPDDIDHYGHVNNAAYVRQMENLAWAHSASLGVTLEDYKALDRAMIIKSHEINYLKACHLGDAITSATWISFCDNRLRLNRRFVFTNTDTGQTALSATTEYVCATLSKGRPAKMPELFQRVYGGQVQTE